jgi:hypothetical protein
MALINIVSLLAIV